MNIENLALVSDSRAHACVMADKKSSSDTAASMAGTDYAAVIDIAYANYLAAKKICDATIDEANDTLREARSVYEKQLVNASECYRTAYHLIVTGALEG